MAAGAAAAAGGHRRGLQLPRLHRLLQEARLQENTLKQVRYLYPSSSL